MLEDVKFQSYCWSLGTTSFRVKDLNFKIEGILKLEDFEEFSEETSSQFILNNSFDLLMKMFSLTIPSSHTLSDGESLDTIGCDNIHSALYN